MKTRQNSHKKPGKPKEFKQQNGEKFNLEFLIQ